MDPHIILERTDAQKQGGLDAAESDQILQNNPNIRQRISIMAFHSANFNNLQLQDLTLHATLRKLAHQARPVAQLVDNLRIPPLLGKLSAAEVFVPPRQPDNEHRRHFGAGAVDATRAVDDAQQPVLPPGALLQEDPPNAAQSADSRQPADHLRGDKRDPKFLMRFQKSNWCLMKKLQLVYINSRQQIPALNNYINKQFLPAKDLFASTPANVAILLIELRGLNTRRSLYDPLIVIQKYARCYLVKQRLLFSQQNLDQKANYIQSFYRMHRIRVQFYPTIVKNIEAMRQAGKLILRNLKIRQNVRMKEQRLFSNLRECTAVITINAALKRLRYFRESFDFASYFAQTKLIDKQITFFYAKTFDLENTSAQFVSKFMLFLRNEVYLSLNQLDYSEMRYFDENSQFFTFQQTNYQLISQKYNSATKTVDNVIVLRHVRSQLDAYKLQNRNGLNVDEWCNNNFLKRSLKTDRNNFSILQDKLDAVFVDVAEKAFQPSNQKLHQQFENSQNPFFCSFTVYQKDLAAIMLYLMAEYAGMEVDFNDMQYKAAFDFGKLVFNQILASGPRTQIIQMIETSAVPLSMMTKQDPRTRIVLLPPDLVRKTSAVVCIQQFARTYLSNLLLCKNFRKKLKLMNLAIPSQVIRVQRASTVIQRNIRGFLGRVKQLIYLKMRDAFVSAIQSGFFVIHEKVLEKLVHNLILPSDWLQHFHLGLSEPVNSQYVHHLFKTDSADFDIKQSCEILTLRQDKKFHQFALFPKVFNGMFGSFSGNLYGSPIQDNFGYIQLNARLLPSDHPIANQQLLAWCRHLQLAEKPQFQFPAALLYSYDLKQLKKKETQKQFDSDVIKTMCGLRGSGQAQESDELLDLFQLKIEVKPIDYNQLIVNIFTNVEISDYDIKLLPKQFRNIATNFTKGLKIIKPTDNTSIEDIALKALLLELTYCDPHTFSSQCNNYLDRKWVFLTSPGITNSQYVICAMHATLILQKHFRGKLSRNYYRNQVRHTSLTKKINQLFTHDDSSKDKEIVGAQRELAAINLIKCAKKIVTQEVPEIDYFKSDYLVIKQPKIFHVAPVTLIKHEKLLAAAETRYHTQLMQAVRKERKERELEENQLKKSVVKQITSVNTQIQRNEKMHSRKLVSKLEQLASTQPSSIPNYADTVRTQILSGQQLQVPASLTDTFNTIIRQEETEVKKVELDSRASNRPFSTLHPEQFLEVLDPTKKDDQLKIAVKLRDEKLFQSQINMRSTKQKIFETTKNRIESNLTFRKTADQEFFKTQIEYKQREDEFKQLRADKIQKIKEITSRNREEKQAVLNTTTTLNQIGRILGYKK